jgi:hypothetical protein
MQAQQADQAISEQDPAAVFDNHKGVFTRERMLLELCEQCYVVPEKLSLS